jgi:hypothetical protein
MRFIDIDNIEISDLEKMLQVQPTTGRCKKNLSIIGGNYLK